MLGGNHESITSEGIAAKRESETPPVGCSSRNSFTDICNLPKGNLEDPIGDESSQPKVVGKLLCNIYLQ